MPEVQKVTDPNKVVTDPVLLSVLAKQGIDKDYVEFFRDYAPRSLGKEHSPCAKFYQDLISGKRFMVVSGLPMVDADGVKIEAGWRVAGINYFSEKNNLFRTKVQGAQVELIIKNDQPDGRKAGDKLSFKPQLFLDGIEQSCGQPILLPIDPVNPNYLENTLEWDYGICKRRLRIIEGRLLGSWVFDKNPKGDVRIKYNQSGDFKLNLGQFKINDDEELIPTTAFENPAFGYPFTVSDSSTFYPDAHPETTSVDGLLARNGPNDTWANARGGNGTSADDTTADSWNVCLGTLTLANNWYYFYRAIFTFDTSALPDAAIISAAVLSIYGTSKYDDSSWALAFGLVQGISASNTALAASDFQANTYTTRFATDISYAGYSITGYNDFTLNATGKAAISKTGVSKFCLKHSADIDNVAPTWAAGRTFGAHNYMAEQGTGYKPKLVVTYVVGQAVGGGALASVGVLAGALTFFQSVGQGAVAIAGSLSTILKVLKQAIWDFFTYA